MFGVILQRKPISILLKYHGVGDESLTVYKAAKNKEVVDLNQWKGIMCDIADALQHIHRCGYIHNDLKSNNVVLEIKDDRPPNPVIIDFGKSLLASKAKNPKAKPLYVREHHKDSYLAPKLIDGIGKPSINTDVFSLCFLIKRVYGILKFDPLPIVGKVLKQPPESRPSISELKVCFSCN